MRSQAQVKQQLRQVTYRHLQRRLRQNFKARPDTCHHNREVILDEEDTIVRLCGYLTAEGQPRHVACDPRIPGCDEMARQCPLWEPLKTKDEIKAEFNEIVQGERGVLASHYPDIAALLWVLDEPGAVPSRVEMEEALKDDPDPEPVAGWFARGILTRLGGRD